MAKVTITTDTATVFSHDVYFEFIVDDTTLTSYSALLEDFGNLKYENEIPNNSENPTDIGIRGGSIDVTVNANLVSGNFITVLEDAFDFVSRPDNWEAKMYYRTIGGSYGDPIRFLFNNGDINYDEVTELIKFELRPYTQDIGTVYDFFSTYSGDISVYDMSFSVNTWDSQLSGEFIKLALEKIYGTTTLTFESDVFSEGSLSTGDEWFVSREYLGVSNNTDNVTTQLAYMATFEGATYGASLGKPFYISRTNTDAGLNKTLDYDNVVKIKRVPFQEAKYRSVTLTQDENGSPQVVTRTSVNPNAEEVINVSFTSEGLNLATIDSATTCDRGLIDNSIITQGAANYASAFGFDNPDKLEVEYWGIDGIYSFSTIVISTDAPATFRGSYKITKIDYDFKNDKVKMELYPR